MAIDDGGPAFPTNGTVITKYEDGTCPSQAIYGNNGASLRDYFAAKAMQGELACQTEEWTWEASEPERLAKYAYKIADAMLAQRKDGAK